MSGADRLPAPWHALLAPLPADAVVRRAPVGGSEAAASDTGAAIAGWTELSVELSAGSHGLRHVLVVLDGSGQPISVTDTVLYRRERDAGGADAGVDFEHHTLGGRLEADGRFLGTRWHSVSVEPADGGEPTMQSTPAAPSADEIAGVRTLVAEVVRRAPR